MIIGRVGSVNEQNAITGMILASYLAGTAATAFAVNKLAHKFDKIEKNPVLSFMARTVALFTSVSASLLFSKYFKIVSVNFMDRSNADPIMISPSTFSVFLAGTIGAVIGSTR